jgi:hypothetical protein
MRARHTDKTFVEIDGADRYYCSQPEKMQECLAACWDAFAARDCSRSDADPQLRAAAPSYSWDAHKARITWYKRPVAGRRLT